MEVRQAEKLPAIYARQSVEKADSISIDSQIEYCAHELRGGKYRLYADRGYSGKNTQRPAYRQMMEDLRAGELGAVVVYKLDRISRSILDFSAMMEELERLGVDFISCSEKFDTSSPAGRAMLSICIVFAQLERETIQERVRDNYLSRCSRGMYMGGRVPFGYMRAGVEGGSPLLPCPAEARQVADIHRLYARPELSCADVAACMAARGLSKRGTAWSGARISEIAGNPLYVRADCRIYDHYARRVDVVTPREVFDGTRGCWLYHLAGKGRSLLVLAPHCGLVDAEIWLRCAAKKRAKC